MTFNTLLSMIYMATLLLNLLALRVSFMTVKRIRRR